MDRASITRRRIAGAVLAAVAIAFSAGVAADSRRWRNAADDPAWRLECGSCHVAYPPAMLAASDWSAIMARLDRHYGVDASVEAPLAAQIGAFLAAQAGRDRGGSGAGAAPGASGARSALPRISERSWFVREHRKVAAATWDGGAVKGPSDCAACHRGAERGDFSERNIRVPVAGGGVR